MAGVQELAAVLKVPGPMSVGKETIVANPNKAVGEYVQEESTNELGGG